MWVRFWIKSNRGTNEESYAWLPDADEDEETIKEALEDWRKQFGAWNHSDNVVDYGWESVGEVPTEVLQRKLQTISLKRDALREEELGVMKALGLSDLASEVRQHWDREEELLNGLITSVQSGYESYEDEETGETKKEPNTFFTWSEDRKKEHVEKLIQSHQTRRSLCEKYAAMGIRVSCNHADDPKVDSVSLDFSAEEWVDMLSKEGEYLPVCCANVSRIRDILGDAVRDGGTIDTRELWEAVQLIESHEDCESFGPWHPLMRMVELWGRIEKDSVVDIHAIPRNLDDPKDAMEVLYACSGVVSWEILKQKDEYEHGVVMNFTVAKVWPAIRTVYQNLWSMGYDPLEGWAVCLGDDVVDSRSGFYIFPQESQAAEIVKKMNADAQVLWERQKMTRIRDIEDGKYDEGGKYEGNPIPPVPEQRVYSVRKVKVSMEQGIEFLDKEKTDISSD